MEHLVQLLHLKSKADCNRLDKSISAFESNFSDDGHYLILTQFVEIFTYEYLKREILANFKNVLDSDPQTYYNLKFYKLEKFDRVVIGKNIDTKD